MHKQRNTHFCDSSTVTLDVNDLLGSVLGDKVYDLTAFIAKGVHGAAIGQGCGTDGTELYETRPMGSGTPHSQNARDMREEYYIGDLE